jgi:hypothetical protein
MRKNKIAKHEKKKELAEALLHVTLLSAIIFIIAYFSSNFKLTGLVLICLSILPLVSLKLTGEKIKESISEIVFGAVNTGLITLMAFGGFELAGIFGAVLGVAVGDAITEGYSGILEGEVAEILKRYKIKEKIDPLVSSLGKMSGALLGGGLVLLIFSLI